MAKNPWDHIWLAEGFFVVVVLLGASVQICKVLKLFKLIAKLFHIKYFSILVTLAKPGPSDIAGLLPIGNPGL